MPLELGHATTVLRPVGERFNGVVGRADPPPARLTVPAGEEM